MLLLLVVLIAALSVVQSASISLSLTPLWVLPANQATVTVPLVYTTENISQEFASTVNFCFDVVEVRSKAQSNGNCFALGQPINFNDAAPGEYVVTGYLRNTQTNNVVDGSILRDKFYVLGYSDKRPSIALKGVDTSKALQAVASYSTMKSTVVVDYEIDSGVMSNQELVTCVRITSNNALVSETCLPPTESAVTASNLPLGTYEMTLSLHSYRGGNNSGRLIAGTERRISVDVVPIDKGLPIIRVDTTSPLLHDNQIFNDHLEFSTASKTANTAEVDIPFRIQGLKGAVDQVRPCIVVERRDSADKATTVVPLSCLQGTVLGNNNEAMTTMFSTPVSVSANNFKLTGLPTGSYVATLLVLTNTNGIDVSSPAFADVVKGRVQTLNDILTSKSLAISQSFNVEVGAQREFVPTYDWQPLHVWHTIPSGIETRYENYV